MAVSIARLEFLLLQLDYVRHSRAGVDVLEEPLQCGFGTLCLAFNLLAISGRYMTDATRADKKGGGSILFRSLYSSPILGDLSLIHI